MAKNRDFESGFYLMDTPIIEFLFQIEESGRMSGMLSPAQKSAVGDRRYSVMQSDGNSFCGDVVLDGFNMTYRDEGSILEQKYE